MCQDQFHTAGHYAKTVCIRWSHFASMAYSSLESWDGVEESGKRAELFTKIIHGPKEAFIEFFF